MAHRNAGPWDFISSGDYAKRYQEIKGKLFSSEEIRANLEKLEKVGVNSERFLTPIVTDIIMRERNSHHIGWMTEIGRQKQRCKTLAAHTRDCAANLEDVVYDEGNIVGGMKALAKQLDGRARAFGMMRKFMGPQINRAQIEILLFFLQGMTGNALRFLPIVERILEDSYKLCGIESASPSAESLAKTYRRHVVPMLPKTLRQNPPRK